MNQSILFLGTSETGYPFNLAKQLNYLTPENRDLVVLSKAGLSPIHRTLLFARLQRERIQIPPAILLVNLVYFTESHDVINDGWLSKVMRSPVFMQMNHGDIRAYLSEQVVDAYDAHFTGRAYFDPMWMQQYLGHLFYLSWRRDTSDIPKAVRFPREIFTFDHLIPAYDERRGVHKLYRASDRWAKGRWRVKPVADCINLKGIVNSLTILRKQPAPILVLILPMNRTYYAYHGLNMKVLDQRYRQIRDEIRSLVDAPNLFLIDLYDKPKLEMGFLDRMHADAYGNYQLARYLMQTEEYATFLKAVSSP